MLEVIALKDRSGLTMSALSLMLGAACVVVAACGGGSPPPVQIDTPVGTLILDKVQAADRLDMAGVVGLGEGVDLVSEEGRKFLVLSFSEPVNIDDAGANALREFLGSAYVTDTDGARWDKLSGIESKGGNDDDRRLDMIFAVPADAAGFTLYVPGNEAVVLPTPSLRATPTP